MLALAAMLSTALPAAAAETVSLPKGCKAFLTVQSLGCSVSSYWRCEATPPGTVWEARFDSDGAYSLSVYDKEFQWLDSQYFADGTRESLLDPGPDPASLTDLLRGGRDDYAFVVRETGPDGAARDIVHQGYDELTGRKVVIDGTELLETEFATTVVDAVSGEEVYSVTGRQYVLEADRLFFLGPDRTSSEGADFSNDFSPIRFIRPGEAGFAATTPRFGCEASEPIAFRPGNLAEALQ